MLKNLADFFCTIYHSTVKVHDDYDDNKTTRERMWIIYWFHRCAEKWSNRGRRKKGLKRYLAKTISLVKLCEYVGEMAGRLDVSSVTPFLIHVVFAMPATYSPSHIPSQQQNRGTSFNAGTGISRAEKYKYQKHLTTKLHWNLYMNASIPSAPLHYNPQDHYHGFCCCNRFWGSNIRIGFIVFFCGSWSNEMDNTMTEGIAQELTSKKT